MTSRENDLRTICSKSVFSLLSAPPNELKGIQPMAPASQRPNLNKRLFSEAHFHRNIGHAKTTIRYKRRKHLFKRSDEKWMVLILTILKTTFLKRCILEDISLCAVPMSSYGMTQALEVSVYFTISLCRKFPILLNLSSILLGFTALSGTIIRITPHRTQKNTPTNLKVKAKGGCEFHVTRNPRGGLYECLRFINIYFPIFSHTFTHCCLKRGKTTSTVWIDIWTNNYLIISGYSVCLSHAELSFNEYRITVFPFKTKPRIFTIMGAVLAGVR